MKHAASPLHSLSRTVLGAALALVLMGAAHADDYADVNQLLRQGKASEALVKADAYIAGKPRDPQMRFLRGVILSEQGKQADATVAFTQLTQDFPELPEPYNNLAALYAAQSQFEKARVALEMAIRLNPNYATAYENLGDVHLRLAAQSYNKAQSFATANASVAPKLTLVRQIITPTAEKAASTLPAAVPQATKPGTRK
ncbi:MAG: tetratricopeptide repeat protein [Variovorax sp.]|jgi:tetratricopeptide (TPR) repeat protein|nr:MAG: tetratricopeptide repeat protein [Variovorax sp.]